jgi:flavin reductase (DIM6/NTAB) family NADH-FMN oxidoreductase RutF
MSLRDASARSPLRHGYGAVVSTRPVPVGPFPDGLDAEEYDRLRRRVLWKLPSGLYLLGSRAGERRNLMTLNWAMQVSLDPKYVAVSVEQSAVTHGLIAEGGCFAVALVAREDREVVRRFVKPAEHDAKAHTLGGIAYRDGVSGAPIPELAVGYLDCGLRHSLDLGSHSLFVGEVLDAGFANGGENVPVLRMEDTRMNYGG